MALDCKNHLQHGLGPYLAVRQPHHSHFRIVALLSTQIKKVGLLGVQAQGLTTLQVFMVLYSKLLNKPKLVVHTTNMGQSPITL